MSVFRRMSSVFQQKVNSALDKAEDPQQALDFSYEKQLEALQQVKRSVADVLTSEKRLELRQAHLARQVAHRHAERLLRHRRSIRGPRSRAWSGSRPCANR